MTSADLLILLSDVAGLYDLPPDRNAHARLLPVVERITPEIEAMAGGAASELSRGGMRTKIEAARIATSAGAHMVIADGRIIHPIARVAKGETAPGSSPRRIQSRLGRFGSAGRLSSKALCLSTPALWPPWPAAKACCRPESCVSKARSSAAIASPYATSEVSRSAEASLPTTPSTRSAFVAAIRAILLIS